MSSNPKNRKRSQSRSGNDKKKAKQRKLLELAASSCSQNIKTLFSTGPTESALGSTPADLEPIEEAEMGSGPTSPSGLGLQTPTRSPSPTPAELDLTESQPQPSPPAPVETTSFAPSQQSTLTAPPTPPSPAAHEGVPQVPLEQAFTDADFFKPIIDTKVGYDTFFAFHSELQRQSMSRNNRSKLFVRNDKSFRKFLTHNVEMDSMHCIICLAFGNKNDKNRFVEGLKCDPKHNSTRLDEHEKSKTHRDNLEALLMHEKNHTVGDLIASGLLAQARSEVEARREILKRIIEIAKLIAKSLLSFRGHSHESSSDLDDDTFDHGNFLELVLLLAKFDPVLKEHVDKVVKESKNP